MELEAAIQLLIQAVVLALATVLTTAVGMGARYLVARLKASVPQEHLAFGKELASTIVRMLAQSPAFENLDGAEKKQRAIVWLTNMAEQYKLPLTEEMIDALLEEAVQIMKNEGLEIWELLGTQVLPAPEPREVPADPRLISG